MKRSLDDLNVAVIRDDRLARYPSAAPYAPDTAYPEFERSWLAPGEPCEENHVYAQARRLLFEMGLDRDRFGSAEWNPLGELVRRGQTVVIKPNMVRHYNEDPGHSAECVVTHFSVVRPLVDYAFLAIGKEGRVVICDAPLSDTDFESLLKQHHFDRIQAHYESQGARLECLDLRGFFYRMAGGALAGIRPLPGDPAGSCSVNLGTGSEHCDRSVDAERLRGTDYNISELRQHHHGGVHEYLVSKTVLDADLLINVPKLKTHHKLGISVAAKNLVGINANKNWLPHYRRGFVADGGDQFRDKTWKNLIRHHAIRVVEFFGQRRALRWLLPVMTRLGHLFVAPNRRRGGGWIGNDTIWRTTLDLNRIIFYFDGRAIIERPVTARNYLAVCDGVVAGQGQGPLACTPRAACMLIGAFNPLSLDDLAARIMGFDVNKLPFLSRIVAAREHPLLDHGRWGGRMCNLIENGKATMVRCEDIALDLHFSPPEGWEGLLR